MHTSLRFRDSFRTVIANEISRQAKEITDRLITFCLCTQYLALGFSYAALQDSSTRQKEYSKSRRPISLNQIDVQHYLVSSKKKMSKIKNIDEYQVKKINEPHESHAINL